MRISSTRGSVNFGYKTNEAPTINETEISSVVRANARYISQLAHRHPAQEERTELQTGT